MIQFAKRIVPALLALAAGAVVVLPAILLGWLLVNGLYPTTAILALVVMLLALRRHQRTVAVRNAGLRARADYEHRLSLVGDPRGLYGRYPPVQAGWFPDPLNHRQLRYFDGTLWTVHAVPRRVDTPANM